MTNLKDKIYEKTLSTLDKNEKQLILNLIDTYNLILYQTSFAFDVGD
jgi:hypothetical protein